MRWGSAVSDAASLTEAVGHVAEQVQEQLDGRDADLVMAFVSPQHAPSYLSVPELIGSQFGNAAFVGCSGGGVIGGGHEVEQRPGVAICAASLPDVEVTPFHVEQDDVPDADAPPEAWERLIGVAADDRPVLVLLPDPFSIQADALVSGLDYAFPGSTKIGGLASGGSQASQNALFLGSRTLRRGAVGIALTGDIEAETIVAQGCRPIGEAAVVTECERNVILKMGEERPLDVLQKLFQEAEERDRGLMRRALHVGILMDPLADTFAAGDFLIRNVLGLDEKNGSMAVGEMVREGQVVQFHLRDAEAAHEDLSAVLTRYVSENGQRKPEAALLFSCLGRGQHLFGEADHDTSMFRSMVAPVPLTGFFCNGEIGPVGGSTFLHGYTSSFAIFGPRRLATEE